ncbi:MAG: hypothetical protein EoVTN8_1461 [Fluviibacter phosphoraccumulans EoVTN8]
MRQAPDRNVFGEPLVPCSFDHVTGFLRDGCCRTEDSDVGAHIVCAVMTEPFLEFSFQQGNDLSTPRPQWQFPGLVAGDQWCLCLSSWIEAHAAGCALLVVLESTHLNVLDHVSLDVLKQYDHRPNGIAG